MTMMWFNKPTAGGTVNFTVAVYAESALVQPFSGSKC
jgi:hypothetical protein